MDFFRDMYSSAMITFLRGAREPTVENTNEFFKLICKGDDFVLNNVFSAVFRQRKRTNWRIEN